MIQVGIRSPVQREVWDWTVGQGVTILSGLDVQELGPVEVAARIRAVAEEAGVPLVSNPPLARALFKLELETEIPAEHYQAVAEIIAYVWRLRGRAGVA